MNFLQKYRFAIGERETTPFVNSHNIYQDGTTPMYRDTDGRLWAMSGHSHMGDIGMFCGTCLDDIRLLYPIKTDFTVGHADTAFGGIRYPEGVKARGSVWPFGLYICPTTHRFFAFFHNETGWNGCGTGYDAYGPCETPKCDFDFRHIGLMHSDDEGRTWTFDRWVLTGEEACFTRAYNPTGDIALGQAEGRISMGSGDFSLFVDEEYLYLFYNVIRGDMVEERWLSCDVYVARTRKRRDGIMGDFVKYYDGAFCEAGNLGRETPVARNAWHPRVLYLKQHGLYMMTASLVTPENKPGHGLVQHVTHLRLSTDLVNWSEPRVLTRQGEPFGNHYVAVVSHGTEGQPCVLEGEELSFLTNHNATDVERWRAHLVAKEGE